MLIEVVEGRDSVPLPNTTRELLIATIIGIKRHIRPQICTCVKPGATSGTIDRCSKGVKRRC